MDSHNKKVSPTELEFYTLASQHNIAPPIIRFKQVSCLSDRYILSTELFPETLGDVMFDPSRTSEAHLIISKARELVSSLHSIGILHNDLSEENIVYDKETSTVAIIDFGLSRYIASITLDEIPECIENLYEGVKYAGEPGNTIEYLLHVELAILRYLEQHIAK